MAQPLPATYLPIRHLITIFLQFGAINSELLIALLNKPQTNKKLMQILPELAYLVKNDKVV
jgi:uncharacterized membrane protein SirB2